MKHRVEKTHRVKHKKERYKKQIKQIKDRRKEEGSNT